MKFETAFGIGEIVIRETNKNGLMVQDRMMEVIAITIEKNDSGEGYDTGFICEHTKNGYRQIYREHMLVGDPDFDQKAGKYPKTITNSNKMYVTVNKKD